MMNRRHLLAASAAGIACAAAGVIPYSFAQSGGKTARMLRLSRISAVATISAPAALPEILSGIRAGVALTLFGTIIGELFASTSGIGVAIMRATDIHNVVDILALTLLLFAFAAIVNGLLHYVERRVHHDG